jgi:hypothetical protein
VPVSGEGSLLAVWAGRNFRGASTAGFFIAPAGFRLRAGLDISCWLKPAKGEKRACERRPFGKLRAGSEGQLYPIYLDYPL